MKSKTVSLIFIFVALILGGVFFISRKNISHKKEDINTRAKIVTPKTAESVVAEAEASESGIENESYETFVPLVPGETLISTYVIDINNDGYDDEVIAVRTATSPYLTLVPAIITPDSGNYTRLNPIVTEFTNTRTFSYSGMDVIGNHKNSLIYQGVDDNGNYIMKIFLYKGDNSVASMHGGRKPAGNVEKGELVNIGDFSCDGTIFIQQVERSESYELSLSRGESFSVWVYKSENSDKKASSGVENQIQQEYKWNPNSGRYELAREIKVTANRLAAKELSRIQDGTVETFAYFLDGLWSKTSNTDGNIRYMYFDYEAKEIILLKDDTEEVYLWEDSKLRHNGMYVSAINADITNLRRRFNVGLVNVDEIYVSLQDYINLLIKENNMWEGNYKKMNLQSSIFSRKKEAEPVDQYITELKKGPLWISSDMNTRISFSDYNYKLEEHNIVENGIYTIMNVGENNIIQFRADNSASLMSEVYSMKFGTKTITETGKNTNIEKVIPDHDTVILSPVKISANDCFPIDGNSLTFVRGSGEGIKNNLSINRLFF